MISHQELIDFFKKSIGPVFCVPSRKLLNVHPKMIGMVGMVVPFTNPVCKLVKVDWSLNKKWPEVSSFNASLSITQYMMEELHFIKPGSDIPNVIDECYDWKWNEFKTGDLVCISHFKLNTQASLYSAHSVLANIVGVVVDKCDNPSDTSLIVSFIHSGLHCRIVNVEKDLLIRLPEKFRPEGTEKAKMNAIDYSRNTLGQPKFTIGETVRMTPPASDETYVGLIGVVKKVQKNNTFSAYSHEYEYVVDFNTLPNRNLSLCIEENLELNKDVIVKSHDLDAWDERISDRPYFASYKKTNKRDVAWLPEEQSIVELDFKSNAPKSIWEGIKVDAKWEKHSKRVSCRDVDYIWGADKLSNILENSTLTIGIEEDKRNPNEIHTKIYLYIFSSKDEIGKFLKFKILLGVLEKRKSIVKKFAKTLIANKFTHPWQIRRYLSPSSLGYLYRIFYADEWLKKFRKFEYA